MNALFDFSQINLASVFAGPPTSFGPSPVVEIALPIEFLKDFYLSPHFASSHLILCLSRLISSHFVPIHENNSLRSLTKNQCFLPREPDFPETKTIIFST